ncbi:MAG: hypothetical protein ACREIT_00870, partial [Tepidisphaeraceae bacterium]
HPPQIRVTPGGSAGPSHIGGFVFAFSMSKGKETSTDVKECKPASTTRAGFAGVTPSPDARATRPTSGGFVFAFSMSGGKETSTDVNKGKRPSTTPATADASAARTEDASRDELGCMVDPEARATPAQRPAVHADGRRGDPFTYVSMMFGFFKPEIRHFGQGKVI